MEKHLNVLGVLYIALGSLGLLLTAFFIAGFVSGNLVQNDFNIVEITTSMATAVTVLMVLISIPQLIVGIGLLQRTWWALWLPPALSAVPQRK